MKCFRSSIRDAGDCFAAPGVVPKRALAAGLIAASICAASLAGWRAGASLPRWMQDVIGSSAMEAALYRVMDTPGGKMLYPRPPREAQGELNGLIGKARDQADLYSLRAMEEEQALDFTAAEADWKAYAARSKDALGAKLELADYYHRRLQSEDEVKTLMELGSAAAGPGEQFVAPAQQQSWKAFERVMVVAAEQGLEKETVARTYAAWMVRYPHEPSLYAREFRWLLEDAGDARRFDRAGALIAQYRVAFPEDAVFPVKAAAMLEYRRGSFEKALAIYDKGFEPRWPAELIESYYALLGETHQLRRFLADARARLAQSPDDLNAMARLFYASQQQGNLEAARQVVEAYRLSKESRKAAWSAQELETLARLMEAIHAYPEAARYNFALYSFRGEQAQSRLASGASPEAEGLSGMIRVLLAAPDQPIALGAGNLSMVRDLATIDRGPGYWNGILSLWLNSQSPAQEYHQEEQRAQPYFHRAKAAELLATLDKEYPKAEQRAELHKELIHVLADYGESALVLKAGNEFLTSFAGASDETNRVVVAMWMADAYARQQDTPGEFALYDRMLTELGAKTEGMPLTAAAASSRGKTVVRGGAAQDEESGESRSRAMVIRSPGTANRDGETSRAFEVGADQPAGVFVAGAQEYQQLLERYLGRLTATGHLPQALAVLRKELDRNPNDPLLYERLASFLQQNNLSAQQEEVYSQAIQKFQDRSWYDKLARLYLREKKREAFADLTKQVTGIFHGTELEDYFKLVNGGGPQLFLQLNLYAHQRFPHDEVFVKNLLSAYQARATRDPSAWEKLLREHWIDSEELRREFFNFLSSNGKLDAELAQLRSIVPDDGSRKNNPAAARELAEAMMWQSHFEESAPLLGTLADAYPADKEIGGQASSVFRSLAYFDSAQTGRAVSIEKQLLAANPADLDRLATIGDIYADSGADSATGHENIAAAAPYWRRMPAVHPGTPDGYLQVATIFWDYFQFDDALGEIREARAKFGQPALYGYEAGAIDEGKRLLPDAIREYTAAAIGDTPVESAAGRLLQLARRRATAKMVDEESAKAVETTHDSIAALELRERVLEVEKRGAEIGPLLEAALGKTTTFEQAQAIGARAQARSLDRLYQLALQREIALASDPVLKIELSYELARSYEGRKDVEDATRLVEQVHHENPKLLGVVRSTTDFYWRNKQFAKAIATLSDAAEAARNAQPALSRQLIVEAADKANSSGSYAQARALMTPLIDPANAAAAGDDAFSARYLAVVADSYARAGDDAGLKQFYLDKLAAIRNAAATMTAEERNQKTVLLRRGLIPALTRMKDYAGAEEQYAAILSAYPEDATAAQEASSYALRFGRQKQLADFAGGAVKASPRDSRFAILLAQIETAFEDYPAAVDAYAHAIAIRTDRADVYQSKADLEERLQRLDDACKEYERLYVLSYQNPDWMVKVAAARARQGRKDDAVKALQRAWIEGHPATARDYFRVATQLENWNMLDDSLHFAELGVKAAGDALLGGAEPGDQSADDPEGAVIYARLMTRLRRQESALAMLDTARQAAGAPGQSNLSPNSPGLVIEQVEKQGLAAVTNEEWRKQRISRRVNTAAQRFQNAVMEMGKTAGGYFTPEEKQQFASLVEKRGGQGSDRPLWIDVAGAAGVVDVEARLRKQVLLEQASAEKTRPSQQFAPYLQLERSRMAYAELAQTMEAYAGIARGQNRQAALIAEADADRKMGDEAAELRVLSRMGFDQYDAGGLRERYLQLLLKQDAARFESFGAASKNEEIAFAAPNYAVAHSDLKVARAALGSHAKVFAGAWENAYAALLGLYYRDLTPSTETAFHRILGDERTIGERLHSHEPSNPDQNGAENAEQLAGGVWFYYGMRYGVYRTLSPAKDWAQRDPEDFLAADLEHNPTAPNYVGLARAYVDAGRADAALIEYGHALELQPDSAAIHDAMALLLWDGGKKDEAIARWREGLAALNRIQNKGPAPEGFWSGFALIAQHLGSRKLTSQLRPDIDLLLRGYLARNGNYRSDELLKAVYLAAESHAGGVEWILSLSGAATDPGAVLGDIRAAAWLKAEDREAILLREVELAQIAASHANQDNDYADQTLLQLRRSLIEYYVAQKMDARAEAILEELTDDQRRDGALLPPQIELAVRGHRLEAFLSSYGADATGSVLAANLQILRSAAAQLSSGGDKADALAIWEFVFERLQLDRGLMVSDYLGLAAARLDAGNTAAAVEVLRRMTLLPVNDPAGAGMANFDLAARLLEERGHDAEAIEFLDALAKGVPWEAAYRFRLAQAQIRAGRNGAAAVATLASIAGDASQAYGLRVQAATAMRGKNSDASKLPAGMGSGELRLLAAGKTTAQQAQEPYFIAARVTAADDVADAGKRALLLREAIAISPAGVAGAKELSGDELRIRVFRAEEATGQDAMALDAVEPLLREANQGLGEYPDTRGSGVPAAQAEADSIAEGNSATETTDGEKLSELERLAPLPVRGKLTDAEKGALATLIARAYEHTGSPAIGLPYLRLAAYLQKDSAPHEELEHDIDRLNKALALEAQNVLRRPQIQRALNQSGVVRPRLAAPVESNEEAQ